MDKFIFNLFLTSHFEKKFLKKNIVLQQNLENFLSWREQKQTKRLSHKKRKIAKTNLKNGNSSPKRKICLNFESSLHLTTKGKFNKIYKPILSQNSFRVFKERIFSPTFFPHKKPFMQLWTFPLLGGCLLSSIMFNKNGNLIYKFQEVLHSEYNHQNSVFWLKNCEKETVQANFPFSSLTKKSNLNVIETQDFKNLQTSNHFEINVPDGSIPFLSLKTSSLPEELNDLCFVYLNLLNNRLESSVSGFSEIEKKHNLLHENFFFEWNQLKRKNLTWIWNPLKSNLTKTSNLWVIKPNASKISLKLFENKMVNNHFFLWIADQKFPQKMKNNTFDLKEPDLRSFLENFFHVNPINSYFESSSLFDNWLKKNLIDSIKVNDLKQYAQQTKKLNFSNFDFLNFLEEFYFLEQKTLQKSKTNENLHSFSLLLDNLNQNQNQLKKLYVEMFATKMKLAEKIKKNSFLKNPAIKNIKNFRNVESFLNRFETQYNDYLKKVWLKNSIKSIQKNSLFTIPQKFQVKVFKASNREKTNKGNPTVYSNVEKTIFFKTLRSNQKNKKKISALFKKKIFRNSFLKPGIKNSFFKNFKINADQSVKIENKFENNFKQLTNELLFLHCWKKTLPENHTLMKNYKFPPDFKLKNSENAMAKLNAFGSEKTDILVKKLSDENNANNDFLKFSYEIKLYYKFKKIFEKILLLSEKKKENLNQTVFRKPILKYQNPILLTNSWQNKSNFYGEKKDLRLSNSLSQRLKPSSQNFSSFQFFTKQTNFKNNLILAKEKSLETKFDGINSWTLLNSPMFSSNIFFQNGIQAFYSFTFQQSLKSPLLFSFQTFGQHSPKTLKISKKNRNKILPNVYLTTPLKHVTIFTKKETDTIFKQKRRDSLKMVNPKFKNRKAEKIFRTYLSIKAIENNAKTNLFNLKQDFQTFSKKENYSFQRTFPTFQKVRERIRNEKHAFQSLSNFLLIKKFQQQGTGEPNFKNRKELSIPIQKKMRSLMIAQGSKQIHKKQNFEKIFTIESNLQSKSFSKTILNFHFFKKANFSTQDQEIRRLHKKQDLQKKRRLKKLKLENRRRKKRKRFYPRPSSLRFQLYSLFLKKRHAESLETFQLKTQKSVPFKERIYRQKKQQWGNVSTERFKSEKNSLKNLFANSLVPVYHEQEFYKISNETLTEFERLCWKSYWLRSNLSPYVRRIQKNFQKMQQAEKFKQTRFSIFQIFKNLSPYFPETLAMKKKNSQPINLRSLKFITPAYLNIKETLDDSFLKTLSFTSFKNLEQKAEYNRLVYERILDEIKNVKSQLNLDGQNHARSYKSGRQKVEKPISKTFLDGLNSTKSYLIEPKIEAFSLFSTPNDASIKPFGDLPTLRLLWACHKTNLFSSKENNVVKNLWSIYKKKEQTKNNKTKKFLYKYLKFQNLNSKTLSSLSIRKTKLASKKIQFIGGFIYGKNYSSYLRTLKDRLQIPKQVHCKNWHQEKFSHSLSLNNRFESEMNPQKVWFETTFIQKPQKRITHFWWSSQHFNPLDQLFSLWVSAPINFPNFQDYISENISYFSDKTLKREKMPDLFHFLNISTNTAFWLGCLLFHVSILFCLIRIPEIRSLAKFQILILLKLTNLYLVSLFSIYDLFQNYKRKLRSILKQTLKVSQKQVSPSFGVKNPIKRFESFERKLDFKTSLKKNKNTLSIFNLQKLSKKTLIQTNLVFRFEFREFFNFSKISSNLKELTTLYGFNSKLFSFLTFYSVSPFIQKWPKEIQKTSVRAKHNFFEKNLKNGFYSWYTGFLWYTFDKSFQKENFQKKQTLVSKKNRNASWKNSEKERSLFSKNGSAFNISVSRFTLLNIQVQSILSLFVLGFAKFSLQMFSGLIMLFSQFLLKSIDLLESILLIFYKFFEKPAELMVDWIAEIFLVEWASDLTTYLPEVFDTQIHQSIGKMSRSLRIGFGDTFPLGFFIQRFFFYTTENIYRWMLKADTDLDMRQKKGIVFWDIWAEILLQAAEKYKMNLSSLSTVKEEQDLLIENLLEQKNMFPTQISAPRGKISSNQSSKLTLENAYPLNNSLTKLSPLLKFLQISPSSFSKNKTSNHFESFSPTSQISSALFKDFDQIPWRFLKKEFQIDENFSNNVMFNQSEKRWAVNQYLTTQGRDTDLFMDIHPPKSFLHISFLKTYLPAQEILGSLVCEIYSNVFSQKISKNILVVGAPGTSKSSFIQALAGETELKIVTDNAHRYAFVQGGIPVGMKLLRDVFDSIALHTPCLFLLEDIHIIGERRPMLISDDENSKVNNSTFGAEQEEVHEKNQLIYQLSRHSLSHYKRPYKGDFSLSLPTNHFSYNLFLGLDSSKKRRSDLTAKSPLPMNQLEKNLTITDNSMQEDRLSLNEDGQKKNIAWLSVLQISADQVFAPPATSPFSILLMKEQKKLKPKKVVKQIPWSGFSYDQFMLISKSNYSVRVKVALLAELAMTNFSVKLDMITDLLVIIDSVRSNRGFVVFATTHVPSALDPALRRPGRLDETISLPLIPNLVSRFEVFKTQLLSYSEIVDWFDYSIWTGIQKQNENQLSAWISKSLLLLLNSKNSKMNFLNIQLENSSKMDASLADYPIYSLSQALQTNLNFSVSFLNASKLVRSKVFNKSFKDSKTMLTNDFISNSLQTNEVSKLSLNEFLKKPRQRPLFSGNDKTQFVSFSYGQSAQFLVEALILFDQTTYSTKFWKDRPKISSQRNTEEFLFKTLYSSNLNASQLFLQLFAGKISEFFVLNDSLGFLRSLKETSINLKQVAFQNSGNQVLKKEWWFINPASLPTNPSQSSLFNHPQTFQNTWQSATNFLEAFFQKRYLYQKNTIVSKLLFFEDSLSLRDPPSPPNSSILMPAKKFENYKRMLKDFIQKPMLTIQEKIQMHQKQRFLKMLYNVKIPTVFTTVSNQAKSLKQNLRMATPFSNSFAELGYLDLMTLKPTSSYSSYKNHVLTRHRFSFLNQWWNGQLAEHNVETTYLSHVDWRSMFVQSLGDLMIDFPDAEQYYNPRLRRWFLNSSSWDYWLSFEKNFKDEIIQQSILKSMLILFNFFHNHREFLDYLAFSFLRSQNLKEINLVSSLIRFHKTR